MTRKITVQVEIKRTRNCNSAGVTLGEQVDIDPGTPPAAVRKRIQGMIEQHAVQGEVAVEAILSSNFMPEKRG